ncbi:26297_t:CDS:1, partial [Dentiscutata erythropus]
QLKTTIMGRVRNPNCAIRDTVSKQWVGFGVGDLHFLDGSCSPNDYDAKILDSSRYIVEDYEVFQILNKVKPGSGMKDRPSKPTSIFGFM